MNYQIIKESETADTALYFIGHDEHTEIREDILAVCIETDNWNDELSPWPFTGMKQNFGGKADQTLETLMNYIDEIEQGKEIRHRYIVGYSLAGLFVLYAVTKTTLFEKAASCSGSLWYEGFADYFMDCFGNSETEIYLSLGEREEKTRNTVMQSVGDKTRQIYQYLQNNGNRCIYEVNEGGHFNDVEKRIEKAVNWMIKG